VGGRRPGTPGWSRGRLRCEVGWLDGVRAEVGAAQQLGVEGDHSGEGIRCGGPGAAKGAEDARSPHLSLAPLW
jgi:hypothetical protein